MTHEQRAEQIVRGWAEQFEVHANGGAGAFGVLISRIASGMAEASNAELERRRALEWEACNLKAVLNRRQSPMDTRWLRHFFANKAVWSLSTFGPGVRTRGITEHIRRELTEIEADPNDVMEWVDVVLLAMDGFWRAWMGRHIAEHNRAGRAETWEHFSQEVAEHVADVFLQWLIDKDGANRFRKWPPPGPEDQPTEHVREGA